MRYVFLLLMLLPWQTAIAQDDESATPSGNKEYRSDTLRMGAFAIDGIKARVCFGPADYVLVEYKANNHFSLGAV